MSVPITRRPSLRAQLSGSLAAAKAGVSGCAGGGSALDPQLRAALDRQPQQGDGPGRVSFAARAALDPRNPEASLELFKRLRSGRGSSGERPAAAVLQPLSLPAAAPAVTDSARHSEAEAATPASQASLADELLDEGWFGGAGRDRTRPGSSSSRGSGCSSERTAFAAAAAAQLLPSPLPSQALPPLPRLPLEGGPPSWTGSPQQPPHPLGPTSEEGSVHSAAGDTAAFRSASAPASTRGGVAAGRSLRLPLQQQQQQQQHPLQQQRPHSVAAASDTPRSAAGSWASALSAAAGALPQTEEEVQRLDLGEVEWLEEEAAELQVRAATALRLARQRLRRRDCGGWRGGQLGGEAAALGVGGGGVAGAPAVRAALQLYLVMLALAEAALLAGAGLVSRLSCGAVSLPTGMVLAPVAAARRAAFVMLAAADLLLRVLGALCGLPAGRKALAAA